MEVTTSVDFNVASVNDNVTLTCNSSGGPNNTYEWMKDGIVLSDEVDITLTLNAVNASSGGDYTCTISNAAGRDSGNVTVYVAPYIVTLPEEQVVATNGSSVSFTCEANGFPNPNVTWDKIDLNMIRTVQSTTSVLEVDPVIFGNEGIYRCVATFQIGGMMFTTTDETTLVGKNVTVIY